MIARNGNPVECHNTWPDLMAWQTRNDPLPGASHIEFPDGSCVWVPRAQHEQVLTDNVGASLVGYVHYPSDHEPVTHDEVREYRGKGNWDIYLVPVGQSIDYGRDYVRTEWSG